MNRVAPLVSMTVILLVSVGLIFLIRAAPLEVLGEVQLGTVSWLAISFIALLQVLFLLLATELWCRAVRVLTGTDVGFASSYIQLAAVAVGKYVPGKVWGFLARAGEMHRREIPVHKAVMSSVVEQMLVLAGAVVVGTAAAILAVPGYRVVILVVGTSTLAGIILLSWKAPGITAWLIRKQVPGGTANQIDGYQPTSILRFVLGYALLWLISGAIFATIYFSVFDVSVTVERIAALVLGNTLGIVVGFFAFFVPGGIGVREAVATVVLAPFLPVGEVLIAAVVYRAWMVMIDGLNAIVMLGREANQTQMMKSG